MNKESIVAFFRSPKGVVFLWIITSLTLMGLVYINTQNKELSNSPLSISKNNSFGCNVVGIKIHGYLLTYAPEGYRQDTSVPAVERDITTSDDVLSQISAADSDHSIKAILLEVDSSGGSPVAASEIAQAISLAHKPVISFIRESGASAAYWAITPSQTIFATLNSSVGGIGVNSSYLEDVSQDKNYVQIISGKYKDYGSPNKKITAEEKALLQKENDTVYKNFIHTVSQFRKIKMEDVTQLADGSVKLGAEAKDLKLIDEIGTLFDVQTYLRNLLNEEPAICW